MDSHKKKTKENDKNIQNSLGARQGGFSAIAFESILKYCKSLRQQKAKVFHQQILNFKQDILEDSLIRFNFNDQVLQTIQLHEDGNRLLGNTVDQALQLLNTAISTPPKFENQAITGVPIYALFMDYLESPFGQSFFSNQKVNCHLKKIFGVYAELLNSKESLKYMKGWISGPALRFWDPNDYEVDQKDENFGFNCWHDFFLKRFKQQKRPIAEGQNVIANVCQSFPLVVPPMPIQNVQFHDNFWLKDNRYSLADMVAPKHLSEHNINSDVVNQFVGGTVYQAFLNPWCYHRWHSPVSGKVLATYRVPGAYYLQNPGIIDQTGDQQNYINSQPFLSCTSVRQVYLIEADNKHIGKIFLVMVGMAEVSGVHTQKHSGDTVKKGQLIGQFRFGGSSHCVIFNKNCVLDFSPSLENAYYYDLKQQTYLSRKRLVRSPLAKVLY